MCEHGNGFTVFFEMLEIQAQSLWVFDLEFECPDRRTIDVFHARIRDVCGQGTQSDDLLECFPVPLLIAAAIPSCLVVDCLSGLVLERDPVAGSTAGHSGAGYVKRGLAAYFHPVFTGKKKPRKLRGFVPN